MFSAVDCKCLNVNVFPVGYNWRDSSAAGVGLHDWNSRQDEKRFSCDEGLQC